MDERTRRLALPFLSFLFGVIGLGLAAFFVLGPERPGAASAVGGPFTLTDQTGATVTEKALAGKPSLVFFGYTHCPDVCPTTLYEITQLYTELGKDADKLGAYFVTVDPERDTPEQLKLYLASFDPHIVGLTGSREALEPVLKGYRVYAKKAPTSNGDYTMDHTALVYLMDKTGRFVGAFNLQRPPAESAKDLARQF
jgi:protein SCO1/2